MDGFVRGRIEAAQRALWRAELTRRILALVIATMAVGLMWIVIDQWIYSPGPIGRSLIAGAIVLGVAGYAFGRLWPLVNLRISEDYAARALEKDHPELGHSLSSYVSLRRQREQHPRGQLAQRVVNSVGANVAAKLRHLDAPPREATGLMLWWAVTIALIAMLAIYALASPKNSIQSVARLVRPTASLDAPRRVQISDVSPGDTETLAGRTLEVAATVVHLRQDEPVSFVWESDAEAQEPVALLPRDAADTPNRFHASIPISHIAHGKQRYRILAGDATAGPFEVAIRDTPVVQIHEVVYQPPAYTNQPGRTSRTGALRGIDGTQVRLVANVNRPITRAAIEFTPRQVGQNIQATAGSREMQIAPDGQQMQCEFPLRLRKGAGIALQDYRLRVWDDAGQSNTDPIVYPIEVVEDLPPEITIVVPQQSAVDVPINGHQILEVHAADVDFGLTEIEIEIRRGIDLIARSSQWKQPQGKLGNHVIEYRFQPSRLIVAGRAAGRRGSGLNVGDELEVVAIATDNRADPNDDSIVPGITRTPPKRLRITAAVEQSGEEGQQGEGQQGEGQQGEGQQGEGQQGEGQQGEGQQGEGQQGEGQQGEGQQGEGQQGEGQQGEGQQGEGQQGEGQQGEGQQGEGQQGEGQQGEGQQGEGQPGANAENEAGMEPTDDNAGQSQQGDSPSDAGSEESRGQSTEPPQDDAEAFERIQEYLEENQQDRGDGSGPSEPDNSASSPPESSGESNNSSANGNESPDDQAASDSGQSSDSGRGNEQEGVTPPDDNQEREDAATDDPASEGGAGGDRSERSSDPGSSMGDAGQPDEGQPDEGQPDGRRGDRQDQQSGSEGEGDGDGSQDNAGDDPSATGSEGDSGSERPQEENGTSDPESTQSDDEMRGDEGMNGAEGAGRDPSGEGEQGGPQGADDSQNASQGDGSPEGESANTDRGEGTEDANRGDDGPSEESRSSDQNQAGESAGERSESGQPSGGAENSDPSSDTSNQDASENQSESAGSAGQSDREGDSSNSPTEDTNASPQGGGGGQSGGGQDTDAGLENELPDPVDLEYTKAATDLVLDYLDETRTDPDPELLQRLKWTEKDLERFRNRWQNVKPIDGEPRPDATASEIDEALRSLGMRPRATTESTRRDAADNVRSLRDAGNRRSAPADVRDAFEAFRRGLGQPRSD
ncbi:hypothetical protein CA85_29370 [Allorhodopirellula solitaria]|uniref:Immunoglobulin G-binding protein A n=2 Tax=Allorhodopirellula solitaria TaxID=2527987 RepID=A0A5C5XVQ6_9BACT|nr:hypothetical protein CA85_29370 [Allorhodopirellula solitaria]